MLAEISLRVELVQVLLYLADRQDKTYQYLNNKIYVDSVEKWFGRFLSALKRFEDGNQSFADFYIEQIDKILE